MAAPKQKTIKKLDDTLAEIEKRVVDTLKAGRESHLSLNPDALARLAQDARKGAVPARTSGRMSEKEVEAAIKRVDRTAVERAVELASLLDAGAKSGNPKVLDRW